MQYWFGQCIAESCDKHVQFFYVIATHEGFTVSLGSIFFVVVHLFECEEVVSTILRWAINYSVVPVVQFGLQMNMSMNRTDSASATAMHQMILNSVSSSVGFMSLPHVQGF